MNIARVLINEVQAAGGSIRLNGDKLKLSAPAPLPDDLMSRLRQAKPVLLAALKTTQWDADDWREYFDERAGILEYDSRHTRQEAERLAYESCIAHWMNKNPPQHNNPDICLQCNGVITIQANHAIAVLTGGGHIWLHDRCHAGWMARRKQQAIEALAGMGIYGNKGKIA